MKKIRKKEKHILLIDQDDVMANFTKAKNEAIKKVPAIRIPWSQYKFFENLEPIEGAIETINELKEYFDVCFLTRPSVINPLSYTEKRVWIEKYFGYEMCKNLILCYDKTMVKGDFLIDDTIQSGRFNSEWEHIHFGSEKFSDWKSIKEYLMKELETYNTKSSL